MKNKVPKFDEFINESNKINEDSGWNSEHDFATFMVGGSIGGPKDGLTKNFSGGKIGKLSRTFADEKEAKETAKRMTKNLSPGERKYYGMSYKFAKLTPKDKEAIKKLVT